MNNIEDLKADDCEIVIVDDNQDLLTNVSDYLSLHFKKVHAFSEPAKAIQFIYQGFPGIVVSDIKMPDITGVELLNQVRRCDSNIPVILMTAHGDISQAVKAVQEGCYDFIEKPFEPERLLEGINRAIEKRVLTYNHALLRSALQNKDAIETRLMGVSPKMAKLRREVLSFANLDVPVLIHGETGAGKEVVAHCLHDFSHRNKAQFVPLNCAAIPSELFESELFGHVKGAFSGAETTRMGKFEFANKGTVFFDEVESIPLGAQVKILRSLSENTIEALGSNTAKEIDIRIISATKEELKDNPDFRQDLYFRMQVAELYIPPLRDRKEDILLLFEHFASHFMTKNNMQWAGAGPQLQRQLLEYHWPGNVRELINVAIRCVIKDCHDLDELLNPQEQESKNKAEHCSLKDLVNDFEASILINSLQRHKGSVQAVLNELDMERRTFNLKLNKYNIDSRLYKDDGEQ
ncbi:Fis family transcriptional regulator [Shewanella hanedai]|uniref:Sigma-54-dependent Fis family transcriptional regulator n=1 Tax=Shewanella hanedai TaxID=25 RepID=A0A553JNF7_SHEHA|nr:sigma-54 dependent transcriptional regulator [Shewanella hanedai]TRY13994.1 sigma-54-dependent Fis family transcriptional regulator [Shewanella hanedai]GGI85323.1 Fis family transcriptional regulator [Shewanella hanedai]